MINLPQSRQSDIAVQELGTEILIYDLRINKAFCLNETSATIWQLCDGNRPIQQLSQILSQKLNKPIAEELIWLALEQLKKENLLENNDKFKINFNGLNRRQAIRKLGLTSMVALPLVSSIVAPSSIHAQSGTNLALLAACSSPAQCSSGNCFNNTKCCVPGTVNGNSPGQGNSPQVSPSPGGDCSNLTQSQRNAVCNSALGASSCCTGMGWVAGGCSTFTQLPDRVQITCTCA